MPTLVPRALFLLALTASACAPRLAPETAAPSERPTTADVSVVREAEGGAVVLVQLSLSSDDGPSGWVPISAERPLRVETPQGTFEAAIDGAPERYVVHVTQVSSARYRLAEAGVVALDVAGGRARVLVYDGTAYRAYAVRRTDIME